MKTKFIMNDEGRFLIEVNGKRSHSVSYQGIATLRVGKRLFAGVSAYWEGEIPHETVFEIKELPKAEKKEENFPPEKPKTKKRFKE